MVEGCLKCGALRPLDHRQPGNCRMVEGKDRAARRKDSATESGGKEGGVEMSRGVVLLGHWRRQDSEPPGQQPPVP